jgi:hypothetical protein
MDSNDDGPLVRTAEIVYAFISVGTIGLGIYLAVMLIKTGVDSDSPKYCSHGGGGESIAYILLYVWPVLVLQVLLAIFVVRTIGWARVVAFTSILPLVMLVGSLPCVF